MMDDEAKEALEGSIKHWEQNVAAPSPRMASTSSWDCALCDAFSCCKGCPVMDFTGEDGCGGTPYTNAHVALDRWRLRIDNPVFSEQQVIDAKNGWREAATKMLEFLKGLRDED